MKDFLLSFLFGINITLLFLLLCKLTINLYETYTSIPNIDSGRWVNSVFIKNERCYNDTFYLEDTKGCVPISFMVALDIDYPKAYDLAKTQLGRKYQDGVMWIYLALLFDKDNIIYGHRLTKLDVTRSDLYGELKKLCVLDNSYQVRDIMNMKGTYLVGVKGHMLCVKDGIIYDSDYTLLNTPVTDLVRVDKIGQ